MAASVEPCQKSVALSPEAVAATIAFLQPAAFYRPANEDAMQARRVVISDTKQQRIAVVEGKVRKPGAAEAEPAPNGEAE